MPTINTVQKFGRGDKVVAAVDMPGVPAGTAGVVYYEAGLRWFRYTVGFDNGVERGSVDGNDLVPLREWRERQAAAAAAARRSGAGDGRELLVRNVREGAGVDDTGSGA